MAVQVWIGEKPEHPNERRAIVALANGLERLEGLYLLLVNFNVGGRTNDLTVIKHNGIFVIELKHCDGKIVGGVNGPWYIEGENGEQKQLNPGRSNPYNQVVSCYYSLTNFLNKNRRQFLSEYKAKIINFRSSQRLVVVSPRIREGSRLDLDWKVHVRGLDELPSFLVTEFSNDFELTDEEMIAIPKLLHCTRWNDVNALIAGILPSWEEPIKEPQPQDGGGKSQRQEKTLRLRRVFQASTAWLALLISLTTLFLLIVLVMRPATDDPLFLRRESLVNATSGPAGGMLGSGFDQSPPRCIWSGFQPVGKRWDEREEQWISVGVDGITTDDLAPQIVVTLEQVDYCGTNITLTWSVRNKSDKTIELPLQSSNISIRDPLGNGYAIDDLQSEPTVLQVEPGEQERGTVTVPSPVIQDAPSLLVRLKEKPFGEASWLVSLDD